MSGTIKKLTRRQNDHYSREPQIAGTWPHLARVLGSLEAVRLCPLHCTTLLKCFPAGCAAFTVGGSSPYDVMPNLSSRLPSLFTDSAPLNMFRRDILRHHWTNRCVDTKAGILRGVHDEFTWCHSGVMYGESTASQGRFQPPTPPNTVRTALAYGPFCAGRTRLLGLSSAVPKHSHSPPTPIALQNKEDCLCLNIYSPIAIGGCPLDAALKFPVIFYSKSMLSLFSFSQRCPLAHGGGVTSGNSGPFPYNMTPDRYVGNWIRTDMMAPTWYHMEVSMLSQQKS